MQEVLRTNDLVLLAYVSHLLDEAGIAHLIFDAHMSAVEGSLGILPRRLMVGEADLPAAGRILSKLPHGATAGSSPQEGHPEDGAENG
jgi:hypothetical protein